ncbi:hypothetical protein MAR_022565 [Mya arenaria]|uniref:Uncharacterized protein n=1 Tax=Mya arenaria TaxID=6604 RepID=A0ABY7DN88_MYAAR|nr:hypothetical protein MAR_022565 [Mya arenaria]
MKLSAHFPTPNFKSGETCLYDAVSLTEVATRKKAKWTYTSRTVYVVSINTYNNIIPNPKYSPPTSPCAVADIPSGEISLAKEEAAAYMSANVRQCSSSTGSTYHGPGMME